MIAQKQRGNPWPCIGHNLYSQYLTHSPSGYISCCLFVLDILEDIFVTIVFIKAEFYKDLADIDRGFVIKNRNKNATIQPSI